MAAEHLPLAESIAGAFGLGAPTDEALPIVGGRIHRMWQLRTREGTFAVKQLNPTLVAAPALDGYRASERVASAFARTGIPAVAAREADAEPLRLIDGDWYLVYEWVGGRSIKLADGTVDQAEWIGEMIGRLHSAHLDVPGVRMARVHAPPPEVWADLTTRSAHESWGARLAALRGDLVAWSAECNALAAQHAGGPMVLTHRDLDPKNVLWDDGSGWLIDWEGAAWVNPTIEIVSAAIDWSGYADARSDHRLFSAVLRGYRSVTPLNLGVAAQALPLCTGPGSLRWLAFNIRRALGDASFSDDDRATGIAETLAWLRALERLNTLRGQWRMWLMEIGE